MDNGQDIQGILRCPIGCSVYVHIQFVDTYIGCQWDSELTRLGWEFTNVEPAKIVRRISFTWACPVQGQERIVALSNGGNSAIFSLNCNAPDQSDPRYLDSYVSCTFTLPLIIVVLHISDAMFLYTLASFMLGLCCYVCIFCGRCEYRSRASKCGFLFVMKFVWPFCLAYLYGLLVNVDNLFCAFVHSLMSTASSSQRGLRLLSIGMGLNSKDRCTVSQHKDGGGIRGLSPLLMLKEVLYRIKQKEGSKDLPRPCDVFDLAGGTGTGGYVPIHHSQICANVV